MHRLSLSPPSPKDCPRSSSRVLDKGVVIMGDIMIKLCDVELLSIHIRLLVCSVDKAREMGVAWSSPAVKPNHAVPPPHSPLMSKSVAETIPGAAGENDSKFQQTCAPWKPVPATPPQSDAAKIHVPGGRFTRRFTPGKKTVPISRSLSARSRGSCS